MPIPNSFLTPLLPNFLRKTFQRGASCFIFRLPFDIHVDNIFVYLRVEDIICLRRVNKAFFLLTHEPIIWKRFLAYVKTPLPPLRPTFRFGFQSTDYEIEQLVTRAISLQDNWRKPQPVITNTTVLTTHYKVLEMKLLPGGKYLIASVKDACSFRFFIIIYHLDHPMGYQALARAPTFGKAFHMQAKYMEFKGEQGIMISYVRRRFKDDAPLNADPSNYGYKTPIDPEHPLNHELICLRIELKALETLANPEITPGSEAYMNLAKEQPPPFSEVVSLVSPFEMSNVSLFDLDGMPYLSVVQQPNRIITVDLSTKIISVLVCYDHEDHIDSPHTIRAIRVFPSQQDMLVIRTVQVLPKDGEDLQAHYVELYSVPTTPGIHYKVPTNRYNVQTSRVSHVHISDYGIPNTTAELPLPPGPPPPISLYFETSDPLGVVHHILWPSALRVPATSEHIAYIRYRYTLDHVCFQMQHVSAPLITHVLPGAYRSLMFTVMPGDRKDAPSMVSLRRYVNPEYQHKYYPVPREDTSVHILRKKYPAVPPRIFCSFPLDQDSQQLYQSGGLAAIAWDEGIGRVCLASENDERIQILDFAHMVHPDTRFTRWKRNQEIIMQGA